MTSTLSPDPYKALGVSKDADASVIKSTYRKLVLKCHPDKVTDESLKKQKQEEFHKIQQAYELIGDEDKRATYDAECKLEQLRREKLSRSGGSPHAEVKTARYDVRTQAPAGATFTASGPHRYSTEERKSSSRSYDDDRYYEERSRKYDTYEAYPTKHSSSSRSSRPERETSKTTRASADRTRSDHKKTRDREERRERSGKFVSVESESSADEKARFEATYKKNSVEEEARREAAEARRKAEDRRSYEEPRFDRQRKLSDQENEAVRHIHRTRGEEATTRPSPGRTSSYTTRPEYYESRSSRREPRSSESVRRSSARPKERPSSSGRDRKGIEIVDWDDRRDDRREERRPMPTFKHSSSSPPDIPRAMPQRAYTESSRDHRRPETSPTPPVFRRSETMPTSHSSSSRRKETTSRSSNLRETVTPESSGPEPAFATIPPPASTTKYYYPTPGGGVSVRPEDVGVANGHRTVLREPERHRTRSPSPLSRPPMGANRHVETVGPKYSSVPSKTVPPPLGRSATFTTSPPRASDDRGRSSGSSRLYGEIHSEAPRRETRQPASFSPDRVSYSRKILPDDIRWAPGSRREERDYHAKPTLGRTATYVY